MHATPDRLRDLLRDLTADDRILLECRIVDGWRYADVAAHLGVPPDVLADRVRRLRTDLRRKAKALGAGGERAGARGLACADSGAGRKGGSSDQSRRG